MLGHRNKYHVTKNCAGYKNTGASKKIPMQLAIKRKVSGSGFKWLISSLE